MSENQLDNYDAEIVEDIPEQFDLSRYKKVPKSFTPYQSAAPTRSVQQQHQSSQQTQPQQHAQAIQSVYPQANMQFYRPNNLGQENYFNSNYNDIYQSVNPLMNQQISNYQKTLPKQKINNSSDMLSNPSIAQTQFIQYPQPIYPNYPTMIQTQPNNNNLIAQQNKIQSQLPQQQQQPAQYLYNTVGPTQTPAQIQQAQQANFFPIKAEFEQLQISSNTLKKKTSSPSNFLEQDYKYNNNNSTLNKPTKVETGRKKNSFDDDDDDENNDPFKKKEYFLKGGEELGISNGVKTIDRYNNSSQLNDHNLIPKSSLKPTSKKPGVTFDEKLEVYEVKNPHYGLDIKSEKREMKKKKKDKQKEEEIVIKTKLDLKSKIQNQNMILFYFYEKALIFNALNYYEENYYKNSISKLQEKLRTSNKADDKLRDQLVQLIEKENQQTIDIIKHIKKDYMSKLEPYLNQYQTSVDKLHSIPGMFQIIQNAANSVNYTEIINFYVSKENDSPAGFRKILGSENKVSNIQTSQIKVPVQRKADIWMPKYVISAIDSHVRDICFLNYKNITDIIYKLNEICDTDLNLVRAIYKYLLTTQLEPFRRNETGSLIMRNYDLGIESTNTIFARFCSFAGIENHLIRGLWKTICQEPGEKVETKSVWNIVNLECGWRFIQPAFTPVKYYLRRPEISYEETEFYFLSDFDFLFYEFLPNDKMWYFSDTVISNTKEYVKEFEKKPIVTPQFRTLNLSILSSNYKSASIGKEPFKLSIKYPADLADKINFKYILKPVSLSISSSSSSSSNQFKNMNNLNHNNSNNSLLNNDNNSNYETNNYNLFVISELISDENAILFKITALPEIGTYNLTIYASLTEDTPSQSSSIPIPTIPLLNQDCKAILSFKIQCSKLSPFEIPPNRISDINVFGTNLIMKRLGLTCCDFKQGILGTDREGKLNLVFEMSQPLDIEAYLYSSDQSISTKFLELCVLKRVVHNFLIIIVNPPHSGLYGLDLHGAPKGTFNSLLHSQLPPIGKFLITCNYQIKSFLQFPKGDNRNWGPKQRFYDLGMHTMGNIDPYIVNEDGKQVEIEIAMLKSLTLWYKFEHDYNGSVKSVDNFCLMNYKNSNKKEKTVSFLLRFPQRGFYHLAVMATDDIFPTSPDEIVYNYLIRVQDPSNEVEPFPIILDPILWKDCCLIAPKNYRLNRYDVHFSILVPRTSQVQITNGEDCIDQLEPKEIENSWVSLVSITDNTRYVYIEAEFENKFKKLVRFLPNRD